MILIKRLVQIFRKPKIKVAYLLESTDLWGGVKVVFRQVEALNKTGKYKAVVICGQAYPTWLNPGIAFIQQDPFDKNIGQGFDFLITTGFRLTPFHYKHQSHAQMIHLCQGYEGELKEAAPILEEIEDAYRIPIPRFVITEKLKNLLKQKFNSEHVFNIGQGLEHHLFFESDQNINTNYEDTINLFLLGPFEADVKQIHTGLYAFLEAKKLVPQLNLIRISLFGTKQLEEEIVGPIQDYHVNIPPEKVAEIVRNTPGLLLTPSLDAEGFGLPPLEAMASGLPTILTRISSFLSFDPTHDYAEFADVGNIEQMAQGIHEIITNHKKRQHIIQRGLEVAQKFNYSKVARNIDQALGELHA